jgi:hypothetical protein
VARLLLGRFPEEGLISMADAVRRLVPDESTAIELPYSEVCIDMRVAGQVHQVELFMEGIYPMARIAGYPPVLPAEAGILSDAEGYYVPTHLAPAGGPATAAR